MYGRFRSIRTIRAIRGEWGGRKREEGAAIAGRHEVGPYESVTGAGSGEAVVIGRFAGAGRLATSVHDGVAAEEVGDGLVEVGGEGPAEVESSLPP
jgi:hypothetical protein